MVEADRESRQSWPTGSGARGGAARALDARRAERASSGRAPRMRGRPSAEALILADGVWGHRKRAGRGAPEHWTGPQIKNEGGGRARKRSSWPTGSGGIGSAQGAERPSTGRAPRLRMRGRPSAEALILADGVWGHRKRAGRGAPEHWTGPQIKNEGGGRARKRSSWPTGSGGIGSAQGAERPSTGRAPR